MPLARVVVSGDNAIIINKLRFRRQTESKAKETRLTQGAVVLQGFGDFSARQVAEVGHGRGARELQVGLGGHNSKGAKQTWLNLAVGASRGPLTGSRHLRRRLLKF